MKRIGVRTAIWVGLLWVNLPVLPLMFVPLLLITLWMEAPGYWALAAWAGGFVAAWLWWSVNVPRWRLWAYARVGDLARLIRAAIAVGLVWPPGHFFERTEIKTAAMRARQARFEQAPHRRDG